MFSRFTQTAIASLACLMIPHLAVTATDGDSSGLIYEKTSQWQIPYQPVDLVQSVDGKYIFVLTQNHKVLIYEPNGQLKGSIPVDNGVSAIETDARGENLLLIDTQKNTFTSLSIDFIVDINIAGSPTMGRGDAPVTIAVFTDFE